MSRGTSGSGAGPVSPGPVIEHVCWSYDDPAQFQEFGAAFAAAGAAAGEYVWYVAAVPPAVTPSGDSARFVDVTTAYPAGHVVDPETQVAAYATATEAALAAGYSALRVVADVTSLVRTPAQLDAFARYEYAINRLMFTTPFRAVCGFDRTALGDATVAELACLHPQASVGAAPFHLYPAVASGDEIVVDGELDGSADDLFAIALRRAAPAPPGGTLVVHGDDLRFVDRRSLLELERYAERHDLTAVLRTPYTTAGRLADLLELHRVRVEAAA